MELKKQRENIEDKAKEDEVKMGRTTKKLLKSFITNLKTKAREPGENSYAPFVQTDYGDDNSLKNNNNLQKNTDKKIRDLWENLKKQMGEYETKKDSQSK